MAGWDVSRPFVVEILNASAYLYCDQITRFSTAEVNPEPVGLGVEQPSTWRLNPGPLRSTTGRLCTKPKPDSFRRRPNTGSARPSEQSSFRLSIRKIGVTHTRGLTKCAQAAVRTRRSQK